MIRITAHPTSTEVVILHVPYEANKAMALFEGATLAPEHRGYVMHVALLDAFARFASHHSFYVLDERKNLVKPPRIEELCDRCGRPEDQCETAAGNTGRFRDHQFTSKAQGERQRHPRRHE